MVVVVFLRVLTLLARVKIGPSVLDEQLRLIARLLAVNDVDAERFVKGTGGTDDLLKLDVRKIRQVIDVVRTNGPSAMIALRRKLALTVLEFKSVEEVVHRLRCAAGPLVGKNKRGPVLVVATGDVTDLLLFEDMGVVKDFGTRQELTRPLAQARRVHGPRVVRDGLLVDRLRLEQRGEANLPLHVGKAQVPCLPVE